MNLLDLAFVMAVLLLILTAIAHLSQLFSALRSGGSAAADVDRELIDLMDRKVHLLEDLRDLELDFRMSKIGEAEYRRRKSKLEPEAVAVIKELERRGVGRDSDEEELDDDDE